MRNLKGILVAFALVFGMVPAKAADQPYYIGGFNVGVFSTTKLIIEPFSLYMFGVNQIVTTPNTFVDLTTIGLNGMDVNPNGPAHMPPDWSYDLFAIYNATDAGCTSTSPCMGFIVSAQGAFGSVTLPAGWTSANTSYRKLMFPITVRGGALAENHASALPMPIVDWTVPIYLASFTTTQTYAPVDVSHYCPENSRFAKFRAVFTGTGNNLWLAPTGGSTYEKLYAYNDFGVKPDLWMRVQYSYGATPLASTSYVYVKFQPGSLGRIDLYLDACAMTEVD